jgi:hypothetical protein
MSEEMHIMKTGSCPSLSGKSTLTYQIGCNEKNELHLSLTGNTGKGVFNKDWIELEQIYSLLSSQTKPITSGSLLGLFEGKNSNSAGFILAVLLKEGLLKVSNDNQRNYERIDQKEYQKIIKAYAKKKSGKKGKEVNND